MARFTMTALSALLLLSIPALSAPAIPNQATVANLGPNVTVIPTGMNSTLAVRDTENPITLGVTLYKDENCGAPWESLHRAMKHKQWVYEDECHDFPKKFKAAWIHKDEGSPAPSDWRCWASLWEGKGCKGQPSTEWEALVFSKMDWEYTDSCCIGNSDKVQSMRFYCKR